MSKNFFGSTQKELLEKKTPLFSKYSSLFVGKKSFWSLLKYELITACFSRIPGALGFGLRKSFYPLLLRKSGRGVVFGRNITLRHPHKISLGANTVLDDNVVLDAKGTKNHGIEIGDNAYVGRNSIISCKEGSITLGDYCNISSNCTLLSETELRLGKYCFLAGRCYLVAGGNHVFDDPLTPIMFQPSYSRGGIQIEDDVWLAAGVIVLDGVSIGKGSVVGAGSVITRSLQEYSIAWGSPAKKVKDRREIKGSPQVKA